jgi:cell division ATPase FtsA
MTELGEEILGIPVRRGVPKGVGGLAEVVRNPTFSTAVGLVEYGVARLRAERITDIPAKRGGLFSRLRRSLSSAF